jgi:2-iminobutanoate/2-iminopropanoate deaminase
VNSSAQLLSTKEARAIPARELFTVEGLGNPQWYSAGARYGDLVWTAGQVPTGSDGTIPDDFERQAELVLDNLERTLAHVGAGLDTLLKVNTYLASWDDFDTYNHVYVSRIGPHGLPPRTSVEIARFAPPMKIELEAVAHVREA